MSEAELASFLAQERTVTCATIGPRGWPHLMPLWYVLRAPCTDGSADPSAAIERGSEGLGSERLGSEGLSSEGFGELRSEELRSERSGSAGLDSAGLGPTIWAWTYAASQKVRNLEREPRVTLQVEAGEQYQELRGAMFECEVVIHRDIETVAALGQEIFRRYASPRGEPPVDALPAEVGAMVDKQAAKRVALEFIERRRTSWDHRKLGGTY